MEGAAMQRDLGSHPEDISFPTSPSVLDLYSTCRSYNRTKAVRLSFLPFIWSNDRKCVQSSPLKFQADRLRSNPRPHTPTATCEGSLPSSPEFRIFWLLRLICFTLFEIFGIWEQFRSSSVYLVIIIKCREEGVNRISQRDFADTFTFICKLHKLCNDTVIQQCSDSSSSCKKQNYFFLCWTQN